MDSSGHSYRDIALIKIRSPLTFEAIGRLIEKKQEIFSETNLQTRFLKVIKTLRLSMRELRRVEEVSIYTIREWYYYGREIHIVSLVRFCHYLGLPVEYFIDGIDFGLGIPPISTNFSPATIEYILSFPDFKQRVNAILLMQGLTKTQIRHFKLDNGRCFRTSERFPMLCHISQLATKLKIPTSLLVRDIELNLDLYE